MEQTVWLVFGSWEYTRDNFWGAWSTKEQAETYLNANEGADEIVEYVVDSGTPV